MDKMSLLQELKNLTAQEDVLSIAREVSELRSKFEDVCIEEDRKFQIKQLEAQDAGLEPDEKEKDDVRDSFFQLYGEFRDKRVLAQRELNELEEANLRRKKDLIARLKQVIEKEENIGSAMSSYKEIHELWKESGNVHREKRAEIQNEYSRLLETFFYHIKIYRELRDHDLHRNHQLKLELIQKVQLLEKSDRIKEIEQNLRSFQYEWDEIGPVGNDEWENLKNTYWDAVRACYTKIQAFYDVRKNELETNIQQKQAVSVKAQQLLQAVQTETPESWENATKEMLALQEEWKGIGFGPREQNEVVWKEFRTSCDSFFQLKKTFFDEIRSKYDSITEKKKNIVAQLESLKGQTDWKTSTQKVLNLQKEWKELGNAGRKNEQQLWKEFRTHCDEYFAAKQAFYAKQDEALMGNLEAKTALIETIKTTPLPENKNESLSILKTYATTFNEIGHVPISKKDIIYNAYKDALNSHYEKLKLEGAEKEKIIFQARLDTLKASPNADKALSYERKDLQDKLTQLKNDVMQYENNLGFFAKSKGADSLRKEVESKINLSKNRMEDIKRKISLLK